MVDELREIRMLSAEEVSTTEKTSSNSTSASLMMVMLTHCCCSEDCGLNSNSWLVVLKSVLAEKMKKMYKCIT